MTTSNTRKAFAFGFALNLVEKYASSPDESQLLAGRILNELNLDRSRFQRFSKWSFIYNAMKMPTCCAGQCDEHSVQTLGHVEIISGSQKVFAFTIDELERTIQYMDQMISFNQKERTNDVE